MRVLTALCTALEWPYEVPETFSGCTMHSEERMRAWAWEVICSGNKCSPSTSNGIWTYYENIISWLPNNDNDNSAPICNVGMVRSLCFLWVYRLQKRFKSWMLKSEWRLIASTVKPLHKPPQLSGHLTIGTSLKVISRRSKTNWAYENQFCCRELWSFKEAVILKR